MGSSVNGYTFQKYLSYFLIKESIKQGDIVANELVRNYRRNDKLECFVLSVVNQINAASNFINKETNLTKQ